MWVIRMLTFLEQTWLFLKSPFQVPHWSTQLFFIQAGRWCVNWKLHWLTPELDLRVCLFVMVTSGADGKCDSNSAQCWHLREKGNLNVFLLDFFHICSSNLCPPRVLGISLTLKDSVEWTSLKCFSFLWQG